MKLEARDLEKVPHVEFRNSQFLIGRPVTGISTDSRVTTMGDLFVALRGNNYDGHAFIADAFQAGAVAAIVEAGFDTRDVAGRPIMVVNNTLDAFGALARVYRDGFSMPLLAIGGSNGKTTTKEMIAEVLSKKYRVLSTKGNLNNEIGVPHTLFRMKENHDLAVVELGSNHPGEMERLCRTSKPTHGILTNIAREHLEFFGTLEGVAEEETQLFTALSTINRGIAIVNVDDSRVLAGAAKVKKRITYGFASRTASVRGRDVVLDEAGCPMFEFKSSSMKNWLRIRLAVPGAHNAINALAAAAAGVTFRILPTDIRDALEAFRAPAQRLEIMSIGGVLVLNDTYNSNPDSTIAALRTLASIRGRRKKIAVLADMKELGAASDESHEAVGKEAAALGIDFILTYGPLATGIHQGAGVSGAIHYDQKNILAEYLVELLSPGDAVLVKGSRAMKMEDIVVFLQERLRAKGAA